ncbi:DUF6368 family protein [Kitasatospora sp. NPDC048298]|uniref:DUF6368 family protein n=1 Tax=Kitasatospora sp. NPDC048298 TaxID=3364049 RepID=UPI00371E8F02
MSGPTLVIDLAEPVSAAVLRELLALMVRLSCRLEETCPACYDVHVPAERLGIEDTRDEDWRRPYPLPLIGERSTDERSTEEGSTDERLAALVGFNPAREDWRRPFDVYLLGAGAGDEDVFEGEHADEPEIEAILGFRAVQAVNVSAACNRWIDHVATALLTAAVMDVTGGVCKAELAAGQAAAVAGIPGLLGVADDGWDTALVTAEFLRAWAGRPGFRLVK